MKRYAARTDANQKSLIRDLRRLGVLVYVIGEPCDLLCGYRGIWFLVEIKNPQGRNRETRQQELLAEECQLYRLPYYVIRDGEALGPMLDDLVKRYRKIDPEPMPVMPSRRRK